MYCNLRAHVQLDRSTTSAEFDIQRGVRQGDPISPLLFNNATRIVFQTLRDTWDAKKLGTIIGSREDGTGRLNHVMFADDTTLVARSADALRQMIDDAMTELAKRGLALNVDKCFIQHNGADTRGHLEVQGHQFPIVSATTGFKILGTRFTLSGRTSKEISARLKAGWAKFHQLWPLLNPKRGLLRKRLRLFDTCVSKSVLWCCESWLPTEEEKRRLQSAQNDMLRRIVGIKRRPQEEWVPWIIRATHVARDAACKYGVQSWVNTLLATKWRWAGHIARMPSDRWCKKTVEWRDAEWCATRNVVGGRPRRPWRTRWFRWEDDLREHSMFWKDEAQHRDRWKQCTSSFTTRHQLHSRV